jgi:serine kinase of HPr protein (carbohydrate metabolism regulator)
MSASGETVHASAVLVGERAVLIRGAAGSGKSRLAWALLEAGRAGIVPYARLVADDRLRIFAADRRLLAAAPETIRGMIEVRGLGVRRVDCEPLARVGLIVDLAAADAADHTPAARGRHRRRRVSPRDRKVFERRRGLILRSCLRHCT